MPAAGKTTSSRIKHTQNNRNKTHLHWLGLEINNNTRLEDKLFTSKWHQSSFWQEALAPNFLLSVYGFKRQAKSHHSVYRESQITSSPFIQEATDSFLLTDKVLYVDIYTYILTDYSVTVQSCNVTIQYMFKTCLKHVKQVISVIQILKTTWGLDIQ